MTPRSFCPECGASIAWYDNIPVLSYTRLGGKCRHCGKPIGARYVVVELITALLFAAIVRNYGWTPAALKWLIFECLLIVLFWTDLEERLLIDELTLGGTGVGLLFAGFVAVTGPPGDFLAARHYLPWISLLNSATGSLALALPFWGVGALYARVRKREGLGLGDVKLLLLLGSFLGLAQGVVAICLGAVSGALIGLAYIFFAKKDASSYELPFGSFLCAAASILPFVYS